MKLAPALAALLVVGFTSVTPAFALFCSDQGPSVGFSLEDRRGDLIFKRSNNDQQNQFDLMRLRRAGVDAASVERWNGCLRAFVRNGGGGQSMQFYDPRTLQRLQ